METRGLTTITLVLFLILAANFQIVSSQVTAEETSIQNSNMEINQAFANVLEAENAGGNVTELLNRLNVGGQLLVDAQNSYRIGNVTDVSSKANSAKQIADQVNTEALKLKEASLTLTRNSFWFTLTFSIGGAIVFGLVMLLIWQRFRRSYIKKMLSMKPEVVKDAA